MLPARGDPALTFAGFLVLVALGAAYWKSVPLESARPEYDKVREYSLTPEDKVAARLWQDPFKTVSIATFNNRPESTTADSGSTSTQHNITGTGECVGQPSSPDKDVTYSDPSGAGEMGGAGGGKAAEERSDNGLSRCFEMLPRDIADKIEKQNHRVIVLPIMVWPGSHPEVEERRRRARFAVHSGLNKSGYAPSDPEHLGIFLADIGDNQRQLVVPYEWFDRELSPKTADNNIPSSVAVLWIDDARTGSHPVQTLKRLAEILVGTISEAKQQNLQFRVIGPAQSGTLRSMVEKRNEEAWTLDSELTVLSPYATVSYGDLLKRRPYEEKIEEDFRKRSIRFIRTIRDDQTLIDKLVEELGLRNIEVPNGNPDETEKTVDADHIVVISEWDTFYGRSLARALTRSFCGTSDSENPECKWVHHFSYQRGIDGTIPGRKRASGGHSKNRAGKGNAASAGPLDTLSNSAVVRRSSGAGQYDYLRRLSGRIRKLNQDLRIEDGRKIRAVFVFGSDVYDKLLIMRALRQQLPGTTWMTTDYDSLLFHPADFRWTRNLVIASTFGSHLNKTYQGPIPPFRDGYQSSAYLAVLMALEDKPMSSLGAQQNLLPVQLLEVGRYGPVLLPPSDPPSDPSEAINYLDVGSTSAHAMALAFLFFAIIALYAIHEMRPWCGRPFVWFTCLFAALGILTAVAMNFSDGSDPLDFTNGVSVWPSEYIRIVIVFLAFFFLWLTVKQLTTNTGEIDNWLSGEKPDGQPPGITLKAARRRFKASLSNMCRRKVKIDRWIRYMLLAAVVIIVTVNVLGRLHLPAVTKIISVFLFWLGAVIAWRILIDKCTGVRAIKPWVEGIQEITQASELWRQYKEHGELKHWFLRAMTYLLVYMAFGTIVFTLLENTPAPCRGALLCRLDGALLGIGVLSTLFLLFVVVDAIRLCVYWLERLGSDEVGWSDKDLSKRRSSFPMPHQQHLDKIRLIGDRTAAVSRLVYYPMLLILMMLLARSTYFDDWGMPQALAVIVGVNFLIAIVSSLRLNQVALKIRDKVIENLHDEHDRLIATKEGKSKEPIQSSTEIKDLIERIKQMQVGAFRRPWDQPVIRASLLILGGAGLSFSEYAVFFEGF